MRRHYVVSYDISDDRRREKVFTTLLGYGDHAQYSVFFCELNSQELIRLSGSLRATINASEDQVMVIDLGAASNPLENGLEVLGRPYRPTSRGMIV